MAQIDSSIYGQFAPKVKSVADYDAEALAQESGQLNVLRSRQAADEYTRKVNQENVLRTFKQGLAGKTREEQITASRDAGHTDLSNSLEDAYTKQRTGEADIALKSAQAKNAELGSPKDRLEMRIKAHDFSAQEASAVRSPQEAVEWAKRSFAAGAFGDPNDPQTVAAVQQKIAQLGQMQTPQQLEEWRAGAVKAGTDIKTQLEAQHRAATLGQSTANDIMIPDGSGGYKPNQPLIGAKAGIAAAGKTTVSVNTGQKGYENESKLRNDFKSEPIYKAYQDMKEAHTQIKAGIAQENPVGDLATATKIMKLLDPGSVVRESELAMAMAASGRLDRLQNFVQMQVSGQKLTPTQRKEFGGLADDLMQAATQSYNAKHGEYEGFGKTYGLNGSVLGPKGADPKPKRRAGDAEPAYTPSAEDDAALQKYLPRAK